MDESTQWDLIRRAAERGYLEIRDNRVRYICRRVYDDDFTDPEEPVRAAIYAWLILEREYPNTQIDVEVTVPRRIPADRADIVVYEDARCLQPYLVVETKERGIGPTELARAIEQAFGNANSIRAKYALFDNLDSSRLYDVANFPPAERDANYLGPRENLPSEFGRALEFRLIAGTPADIRSVSASDLENRVRRAHGMIWAGGMRDPLTAFNEWSKLIFAKVHDERHTPNGQPRRFQVGAGESAVRLGNRIRALYDEARIGDPSIFSEPISLPDDKIREVVRTFEEVGLTLMDVDALGAAFEAFFGTVFREELGQYFTPRPLVRFTVAMLMPQERDILLDPTAGTGGFLLEALFQVWKGIDKAYAGQPELERRKYDFARQRLYGIEVHPIVGRICQTNLLVHRDGHTNIEVGKTCLDASFRNHRITTVNPPFTIVLGNPPFGDAIEEGDSDRLGSSHLDDFELARGRNKIDSEIVILERAIKFLAPGGRLGMVVPDGLLNNTGEQSRCPAFRRFLLKYTRVLAVVSLPDHAFRKQGAQNKTSLLFCRRYTQEEERAFERSYSQALQEMKDAPLSDVEKESEAIKKALIHHRYKVFMAEANNVGYTATGMPSQLNDLYHAEDRVPQYEAQDTILGQYVQFLRDPDAYEGTLQPPCLAEWIDQVFEAHKSHRLDPKYHLFKREEHQGSPEGMKRYKLGDVLRRRREALVPYDSPDREFLTLTLTQEGELKPREAGVGNNPPAWFGIYFTPGVRWYRARAGDLIVSRIDVWKGCVSVIPDEYDGAIVTQEFPIYAVREEIIRPYYLKLLLRTDYFRRAIRAVTTGHSNRRRTQDDDFENLEILLPDVTVQDRIIEVVRKKENDKEAAARQHEELLTRVEKVIMGSTDIGEFLKEVGS
ncbi:MAG TPA: N-6 DNA methylase [Dehalococcoidia bacterium]|nr:N-6 DNA methylase [Dehalococcoidia bacterium]